MGLASTSAVRVSDPYGSLGGAFGGGERRLKKKPVLVLDPEELAKAHHLFQIGAAEQLGEFDPRSRVSVPAAAVFGVIQGGARFTDEDDDYVAPLTLVEAEEEPEDDLPPIDLDAVLALSRAEQEEEERFYREQAEAELAFEPEAAPEPAEPPIAEAPVPAPVAAVEPSEPLAKVGPVADTATADALARILSRAAASPKPAAEPAAYEPAEVAPIAEPVREEPAAPVRTFADESFTAEPDWLAFEQTEVADEPDAFDLPLHAEFDGEAFVRPDAPLRVMPIIGEEGTRSSLRARLVREELSLAHPEPSIWRKLANGFRRLWQRVS